MPDEIRLVKVVRQGLPPLTHSAHSLVWLRGEPGLRGTGHCSGDLRAGLLVGADIAPQGVMMYAVFCMASMRPALGWVLSRFG